MLKRQPFCLTCTGPSENECTKYQNNTILIKNSCVCIEGYYKSANKCEPCQNLCLKFTSADYCEKWQNGFFENNGQCTCPSRRFSLDNFRILLNNFCMLKTKNI